MRCIVVGVGLALMLSGCASLRNLDVTERSSIPSDVGGTRVKFTEDEVIAGIRCDLENGNTDLKFLKWSYPDYFGVTKYPGWTAGVSLTVDATNLAKTSGNTSLAVPLHPTIGTPALSGFISDSGERIDNTGFKDKLPLQKEMQTKMATACSPRSDLKLTSRLGLNNMLKEIDDQIERQTQLFGSYSPDTFVRTVKFTFIADGTVGGAFSLVPLDASILGAGASLENSGTTLNQIILTLSKNPKEPPPTNVIVVADNTSNGHGAGKGHGRKPKFQRLGRYLNDEPANQRNDNARSGFVIQTLPNLQQLQ